MGVAAGGISCLGGGMAAAQNGVRLTHAGLQAVVGSKKYNVLFVLVDAWRYCSMGHGYFHDPVVRTPNLDSFAKQGAHWQWCYSTQPLCTPCRSAIITGRYPHQTNMEWNDNFLPQEERCIAHEFTDAGYNCYYIGKWHMDQGSPGFVPKGWRRRGFTKFEGFNSGHRYLDSQTFDNDGNLMKGIKGVYEPTFQTDLAIQFMRENKKRPFFCFMAWGPPHGPDLQQLPEFLSMYSPDEVIMRPNTQNVKAANRREQALYFGHCTALDAEFGRLMKSLDQLGLRDNTLVVFTADHGDLIRSHNKDEKSQPEEESCHVPLLMRLPGYTRENVVIEHAFNSVDLMPTLLSVCGLNVPSHCMGTDKSAALRGETCEETSVYSELRDKWRLVFKDGHKLIIHPTYKRLYDLRNDPYELNNVFDHPDYALIRGELLGEYAAWKQKTDDYFVG